MFGKQHSKEMKNKISLGVKNSMKAKTNVRILREIIICPHCNKVGGRGGMKRWHFDNCKGKV